MNYLSNMETQLPFPTDKHLHQYLNLSVNNPPYVPQNYNAPQWLFPHLQSISAVTAIEIQNESKSNALRVFSFNQLGINNFNNNDFDSLVRVILDFIVMVIQTRKINTLDAAIEFAVPKLCECVAAFNVTNYPALLQCMHMSTHNYINNSIQEFRNILNEIKQFQMSGMQVQMNNQYPQQMNNQNTNNYGNLMVSGNSGMRVAPSVASNVFGNVGESRYTNRTKEDNVFSIDKVKSTRVDMSQNKNVIVAEQEQSLMEVDATTYEGKWVPIDINKSYFPAYNPYTEEVKYVINSVDNKIFDVYCTKKVNCIMDEDRHRITTIFGKIPNNLLLNDTEVTFTRINGNINALNKVVDEVNQSENVDTDIPLTYVNQTTYYESSVHDAWLHMSAQRVICTKAEDGNMISTVFRGYYDVVDTVFGETDDTNVLAQYARSMSYIELRDKMQETVNKVGVEFWAMCNRRMTTMINDLLKHEMAIPRLSMDNFCSDIEALLTHLSNKFGSTILDLFLRSQASYIKFTLHPIPDSMYADMIQDTVDHYFVDIPDISLQPKVTYMLSHYLLTYIDCLSYELNIELRKDIACSVNENSSPLLYNLMKGLFRDLDSRVSNGMCLIKTKDGKILKATRGLINSSCYLLALVS